MSQRRETIWRNNMIQPGFVVEYDADTNAYEVVQVCGAIVKGKFPEGPAAATLAIADATKLSRAPVTTTAEEDARTLAALVKKYIPAGAVA